MAEAIMGWGPGSSGEVWQRWTNVGFNTQVHGNNIRNFSVQLSISQTSKSIMSFLLSPMFSLQQNQRIGWNTFYKEVEGAEWGGGPNNVYIYK
jgi:hypothetical protein